MSELMRCWAVVPATGIGSRMASDRPKQYIQLQSKSILEWTLDNLLSHPQIEGVVLVLNEQDQFWNELNYQSSKPLLTCVGGAERHQSVSNGLRCLQQYLDQPEVLVLIHDSVRPFARHDDITRLIDVASSVDDGAILSCPVADTLKLSDSGDGIQKTVSRDKLWRALTPQAFRLQLIVSALNEVIENHLLITDDASAMEMMGFHPRLVNSDSRNIKITHPDDLNLARLIANNLDSFE